MRSNAKLHQHFWRRCLVHITLRQAAQDIHGHRTVPDRNSPCTTHIQNFPGPNMACEGEVRPKTLEMTDFIVDVELPLALLDAGFQVVEEQDYRV